MTRKAAQDALAAQGIQFEAKAIEVIDPTPVIDPIGMTDLAKVAAEEAFMNEFVTVRLATTTDPSAPPLATLTVNDVNQRVQLHRGVPYRVRRFHVEVLARMRETRHSQPPRNLSDPESGNYLIAQHAQVFPFEVLKDDNPRGRPWLEHILYEQA
jgi:hypothetical protein